VRFFAVDGLRKVASQYEIVSGGPIVWGCRMFKSPAELALMQLANDVTLASYRHIYPGIEVGMSQGDISQMMSETTRALGGSVQFSMALIGESSAYPHGSDKPQTVKEGDIILMDCGATVQGYQSDISRTFVFGEPTKRHREIWNIVRDGQAMGFEAATLGTPTGQVDDVVGMCLSNEPGLYIYGEFGVRLEDCLYMTESGPKYFTTPPTSLDDPIG